MSASSDIEADAETEVDVDEVLAHVGHGPAHHHHASGLVGRISLGLVDMSMRWPKRVVGITAVLTIVLLAMFVRVQVDTDPESMLSADAPVRVLNEEIRAAFGTRDMIVVGLFSDENLVTATDIDAAVVFHDAVSAVDGVAEDTMISVRTAIPDAGPDTDAAAEAIAEQIAADPLRGAFLSDEFGMNVLKRFELFDEPVVFLVGNRRLRQNIIPVLVIADRFP